MSTWDDLDSDPWVHWGPAELEPHHRQARQRTDDEDAAVRTRRHFNLPDGVDHAAAHHPDDPDAAQRHRDTIAMLRGSLARQVERGGEGRP